MRLWDTSYSSSTVGLFIAARNLGQTNLIFSKTDLIKIKLKLAN